MARIHELVSQIKDLDSGLAEEISKEVAALSNRREFGLNFERHTPEQVELPGRQVRKGDKVHILAPRGETPKAENKVMWVVMSIDRDTAAATIRPHRGDAEIKEVPLEDLVVVAEFRDPIYPGLVSTGRLERGGDGPFHTVINAENFHALELLLLTHRAKVDVIYIDPPYNTGARDWKYNNDYVESDDLYRHSKWLAFIERRLLLAKELLNPVDSVLIATIDEKEYLRLGLLLEQTFPEASIRMVSSNINPGGSTRRGSFSRSAEYIFFVQIGASEVTPLNLQGDWNSGKNSSKEDIHWHPLARSGQSRGNTREGRPKLFYPIYVKNGPEGPVITSIGEAHMGPDYLTVTGPEGSIAIWPVKSNGTEGCWGVSSNSLKALAAKGFVRLGKWNGAQTPVYFLQEGMVTKVESNQFKVTGRRPDGSIITDSSDYLATFIPDDVWKIASHNASAHGTNLLRELLPDRKFPFPKSLYAVEDCLRFFVAHKPHATIVDFFSGSGTTAHAVMRLNRQDQGQRKSISITNNELEFDESKSLTESGLRPGDVDWESRGICEYITKPRIKAAITGRGSTGLEIPGDYRFTDEFPKKEGFAQNVEFFNLTYENPLEVESDRAFERISPILWLKAGAVGQRIETLSDGWLVGRTYGVLKNLDKTADFVKAANAMPTCQMVFIFTSMDRVFESIAQELSAHIEPIRMPEFYFRNFETEALGITR